MTIYAGVKKCHLWIVKLVGFGAASRTPVADTLAGAAAAAANPHLQR
jgi:hypothetical protein